MTFCNSIASGSVFHVRHQPRHHGFSYPIYMMLLDLEALENNALQSTGITMNKKWSALSFCRKDYFGDSNQSLLQTVINQAQQLNENLTDIKKVYLLGQLRSYGFYFSPVNFYFLQTDNGIAHMLAEVSNTPWNEKHCYLIDISHNTRMNKQFHVSPFMDLDMQYHWEVSISDSSIKIHIENWKDEKIFAAGLELEPQSLSAQNLKTIKKRFPMMTFKIMKGIYWQALKLFIKKIPYYSHPGAVYGNHS